MGNNQNSKSPEDLVLTRNEIELAKVSWQKICKYGLSECGVGIMTRIMIEHKELKGMWRKRNNSDNSEPVNPNQMIKLHGEKILNTIKIAINSIDDLNSVAQNLNQLGYDHYKYGTRVEHFPIIGEALISTLSDALREEFTDQIKKLWLKIFTIIEIQMKLGMLRAESEL